MTRNWLLVLALAGVAACSNAHIGDPDGGGGVDTAVSVDANTSQPVCGDGMLQAGEDCDLGGANGLGGTCCNAQCQFVANGQTCRPAAASGCDLPEACTGLSAQCPADAVINDGGSCSVNGGSTCCGGACSITSQMGTCNACSVAAHGPQRITIIESQSENSGHNMDVRWQAVATAAGHTATIVPQTALDSITSFDQTDILIVSSGVIALSQPRRAVIDAFASSHRGVYLQGEYLPTYQADIAFGEIVTAHGGSFSWIGTVSGQQDPTMVNGCLANTPELAPSLTAYWYAATANGTAPKLEVIHTAPGGQAIGWSFCLPGGGLVIHNTDQDFIRDQAVGTPEHMRNVLVRLADAATCDGPIIPNPT